MKKDKVTIDPDEIRRKIQNELYNFTPSTVVINLVNATPLGKKGKYYDHVECDHALVSRDGMNVYFEEERYIIPWVNILSVRYVKKTS